jgi:hypothetical protein
VLWVDVAVAGAACKVFSSALLHSRPGFEAWGLMRTAAPVPACPRHAPHAPPADQRTPFLRIPQGGIISVTSVDRGMLNDC